MARRFYRGTLRGCIEFYTTKTYIGAKAIPRFEEDLKLHKRQIKALSIHLAAWMIKNEIRNKGEKPACFSRREINARAREHAPEYIELAHAAVNWFLRNPNLT